MFIKPKDLIESIDRPDPDTSQRSNYFRFERNERTTLFTKSQFVDMLATLSPYDLVAYGELEPFYNKIQAWLGVKRTNILLTSGSDAGIKAIYETYINEEHEVIISLPNYAMFSVYAAMFGAREVQQFYDRNLSLNCHELIDKINDKTRLVVISNPGHTGTVVPENNLKDIIVAAKELGALVIIDEAYHNFYSHTMIDYIFEFDNIIITRTFSKAFGLASLRIGLLIASNKIIENLYKVKLVHEISGIAAKIGQYCLDHLDIVDKYVADVNCGKDVLYERLSSISFEVLKSKANFVFFKTPKYIDPYLLKQYLEENKILIKGPFKKHPFDNHLRITVGDKNQMDNFCDTVENFLIKR